MKYMISAQTADIRGGYIPDEIEELGNAGLWTQHKRELEKYLDEHVRSQPEYDREMEEKVKMQIKEKIEEDRRNYRPTFAYDGVSCPYCQSPKTKKISGFRRGVSAGLLGVGSPEIGKQWHCKNCGSDF